MSSDRSEMVVPEGFNRWGDLPQDVLFLIAPRLVSLEDLIRFGSVCSSWRSVFTAATPFPSHRRGIPWLVVPHCGKHAGESPQVCTKGLSFFSILDKKTFNQDIPEVHSRRIWGSSARWLTTLSKNSEIQLLHPFSRKVVALPTVEAKKKVCITNMIYKVITSPSSSDDFAAIAIVTDKGMLAYCRPGKDEAWIKVAGKSIYNDVTFYKGKFYAVSKFGGVFVVEGLDGPSPKSTSLYKPNPMIVEFGFWNFYLVESSNDLLKVFRSINNSFKVFKLSINGDEWVEKEVENLGDRSLFVGYDKAFSVSASDYDGCEGNCIYFSDDDFSYVQKDGYDIGVFRLKDRTIEIFSRIDSSQTDASCLRPIWFAANQF